MDISESVGMGRWQLPPLLLTLLRGVPSAMLMMIINFAAPRTRIWCNNDLEDHENFTRRNNLSENESATLGECWTKTNDSIVECKSWSFDHSVFSWTITEEFHLVCQRAWLRAMSQSFYMVGMLMGNLIFSHLSDRYGRRISVILSSFFVLVFGFLGAFSPSLTVYNVTRVFASIGTGGLQSTSITLCT
ncbi:solute carrier family 22 member 6 [Ixodes scapularis]|uniref:solute carrier family 22 member 6 n=1 Tax=Ixodes scapularis TaxID=6945 RepID=UPI001A9E1006|nr:solute carrier family 22 member 6 [Ixodes scapularis]